MKNINELDVASILKNLAGDTAIEVDFIDLLQSVAGIASIPGLGFVAKGLGPLLVKLSIEEILEKISSIVPIDKDAEESIIPYLAAIKDIEDLNIKAKELEPLAKDADTFMDQMLEKNNLEEGRKKTGTKLCSRGKSAAKSKFDVYPSAYANGYAVSVCKGRIKGLDGKKRCSPPYC